MKFEECKYIKNITNDITTVFCKIDGSYTSVRIGDDNYIYVDMKKQVDAGEITIEPADE
jgi:hypothetical protein